VNFTSFLFKEKLSQLTEMLLLWLLNSNSIIVKIDRNIFLQDGAERLVLSWGPVNIDIDLYVVRVLPDGSSCRTYEYNTHGCNGTVLEVQASGVSLRNVKI
jgi:hypothetical protein